MAEDTILQQILMDTYQVTRSGWKISGLFSQNEIRREVKTEVLNEDLQRNTYDYQMTDLNYNSLLPMPYYDDLPQHIQPKVELDIPRSSVLDEEADWDLRSFDDIENIDCEIFSELSDLVTTEEGIQVKTEDVKEPKPELPAITSKPSVISCVARNIKHPVSQSSSSLMSTTSTGVTVHFLDHNYADHNYAAPIVPKTPAMHPAIDNNACPAIYERRDAVDEMDAVMSKTTKYVERRKKNNLASRRSRETRKRKYVEMQEQVFELERKNAELRNRVSKMEWLSCTMKRSLFEKKKTDVLDGFNISS